MRKRKIANLMDSITVAHYVVTSLQLDSTPRNRCDLTEKQRNDLVVVGMGLELELEFDEFKKWEEGEGRIRKTEFWTKKIN